MTALKPKGGSHLEPEPKELRELVKLVSTINRDIANTQTSSRGLRVCSTPDAAFSSGDWSHVTYHPSGLYHLVTNTLSLLGVDSPLPPARVRLLIDRAEACLSTRALFDAIHTRLLARLCQGLCELDLHSRASDQRWPQKILALGGLRKSDLIGLTDDQQSLVVAAALRGRRGITTIRWICQNFFAQTDVHSNVEVLVGDTSQASLRSRCVSQLGTQILGQTALGRPQQPEPTLSLVFREVAPEVIRNLRTGPVLRQLAKACQTLTGAPRALSCTFYPTISRHQARLGNGHVGHLWVTGSQKSQRPVTALLRSS